MRRALPVVIINLAVAGLHFLTGADYCGPFKNFVNGHMLDVALPFALYFLLCMFDGKVRILSPWWVKALLCTLAGTFFEILQLLELPSLGNTFDPMDIAMYTLGSILAAIAERQVFARFMKGWNHFRN